MKQMTKQERIEMAPGGLDPLEVFEGINMELSTCYCSHALLKGKFALQILFLMLRKSKFVMHLYECDTFMLLCWSIDSLY